FCNTWNPEAVVRSEFPITWKTARGLVAAAGPVCDVSNIAISSIIAWKMISCNKRISLLFAAHAFDLVCNICLYSFSGIIFPDNSNDFVNVEANLGISRYVQTTITVALVFATFTLLNNLSV
ncbi:MAG: hypothetical protein JSS09_04815, partial [Verrucomicrobia bacterium]|nr:hypothetical protein [Verrucomicrobiota bacterium]